MNNNSPAFNSYYTGTVAIVFSGVTSGYWILGNTFDVYTYAITGAIFEMLWILMVPMLFIVPIVSLIAAIMNKFRKSYLYFISIVINLGTFMGLSL